jgi:hypothetical protein
MITPEIGKKYVIHHSSGNKIMTFIGEYKRETTRIYSRIFPDMPPVIHRGYTHYIFRNDATGREVQIKSRLKIRREIM